MEKLKFRHKILLGTGLAFGGLALVGCSNPDGTGNDFHVTIEVEDTTHQSITGRLLEADRTDGVAEDWFSDIGGTDEFHDNCDCHGAWRGRKQYGELYDIEGMNVISPETLALGTCVEMTGKIRDDQDPGGKTVVYHERPVYEHAQVVACSN